jgi:hypothetical protein
MLLYWQQNVTWIAPIFIAVAALAAAVSAAFSFLAMRTNKRLTEARILFDFKGRYNSDEMGKALRELAKFRERNGDQFVDNWISLQNAKDPIAEELDGYRRLISSYYTDLSFLLSGKFISKGLIKLLLVERGINVFVHVVEPFERKSISNWDFSVYDQLKSMKMHDSEFKAYFISDAIGAIS